MHVRTKQTAFTGMAVAIGVIFIALGGIFENATLFFVFLAAFIAGALIHIFGLMQGVSYAAGVAILSLIIAPQKLYVFTFIWLAGYILFAEYMSGKKRLKGISVWVLKALFFNTMAALFVVFYMLIFGGSIEDMFTDTFVSLFGGKLWVCVSIAIIVLELVFVAFDRLYHIYVNRYMPSIVTWMRRFDR